MFDKNAEVVSEVRLVVEIGNQLQIYHESTAKILELSDLTEDEQLKVKENYNLDEKFYPRRSEIDKGIKCSLDQINHCIFKCITGLIGYSCNLKWPEMEGRNRISKFIREIGANSLILDVNKESTDRK